jgi:hypothetical protein
MDVVLLGVIPGYNMIARDDSGDIFLDYSDLLRQIDETTLIKGAYVHVKGTKKSTLFIDQTDNNAYYLLLESLTFNSGVAPTLDLTFSAAKTVTTRAEFKSAINGTRDVEVLRIPNVIVPNMTGKCEAYFQEMNDPSLYLVERKDFADIPDFVEDSLGYTANIEGIYLEPADAYTGEWFLVTKFEVISTPTNRDAEVKLSSEDIKVTSFRSLDDEYLVFRASFRLRPFIPFDTFFTDHPWAEGTNMLIYFAVDLLWAVAVIFVFAATFAKAKRLGFQPSVVLFFALGGLLLINSIFGFIGGSQSTSGDPASGIGCLGDGFTLFEYALGLQFCFKEEPAVVDAGILPDGPSPLSEADQKTIEK